jgi:putative phosphoribosyl transferase
MRSNFFLAKIFAKILYSPLMFMYSTKFGNMVFATITNRFQFKFRDRTSAGNILGEVLKNSIKSEEREETVVFGIPRGGVITADRVAKKLSAFGFDLIITKKLTYPNDEEQAVGAVAEDGITYLDVRFAHEPRISPIFLEQEKSKQLLEIKRRAMLYLERPTRDIGSVLKDRIAILVDDGAATGATIIAAAKCIRRLHQRPNRLIIGVPIAPRNIVSLLERECEAEVKAIITPASTTFHSVEQYYKNFEQISDEQVISLVKGIVSNRSS